jgi:hypothetical protein
VGRALTCQAGGLADLLISCGFVRAQDSVSGITGER